jgi:hemoglobin-like flavoprotein
MNLDARLLREHFESLRPTGLEVVRSFYAALFKRFPAVQPLFAKTDMTALHGKFFETLDLVVQNLEKPDELLPHLMLLGNGHIDYGVEPAHYDAVRVALMEALRDGSGARWTPELERAWHGAYDKVAEIMKKGAKLRGAARRAPQ